MIKVAIFIFLVIANLWIVIFRTIPEIHKDWRNIKLWCLLGIELAAIIMCSFVAGVNLEKLLNIQ